MCYVLIWVNKDPGVGGEHITNRREDILWQRGAKPWQRWHIRVANSSNDGNGGMCHTEQMGERGSERGEDVWESALAFAYIPGEVARGKGLSALFRSTPP